MKYSDHLAEWLVELGYTTCFFVAGGNIMHLIESLSNRLDCKAVVHEVAAGIAAEYFNATSDRERAVALVTAGPGLTNIISSLAGAYLESRELLVIGGQVKTTDLAKGGIRQRGIQEVDGVSIAAPVAKRSELIQDVVSFEKFRDLVAESWTPRKGPVFLEIPLDIQAKDCNLRISKGPGLTPILPIASDRSIETVRDKIFSANRPILLLGGGVNRDCAQSLVPALESAKIPVATTWNGLDRVPADSEIFVGRPDTWGQRSANLILQQADLVVALGSRLGLQQTGFNWQEFVPVGQVIQIDLDNAELEKGHPKIDFGFCADANDFLKRLLDSKLGSHTNWLRYAREIRSRVPLIEDTNRTNSPFISPYVFCDHLSDCCDNRDVVIPCSSGGASTVMMQTFRQRTGQIVVNNKALASMGYGLSGAIGAAVANPDRRTILVEGDGGFCQNIQELGTVSINELNLKIFIFDNSGYASIRMTQKNYFGGRYVGCDIPTGLGMPQWEKLFAAWEISSKRIGPKFLEDTEFKNLFESKGPTAFIVSIDPEQTYFPKITSRVTDQGSMESNPLHKMTPELEPGLFDRVGMFLPK
ncbi:thiamine pyrophosphate-binding protein [Arenicellales bacterium nBUS_48]